MSVLQNVGRMLLGAAIFRSMRLSPKWALIAAALVGLALMSMGTARAQDFSRCTSNDASAWCQTQAQAGPAVQSAVQFHISRAVANGSRDARVCSTSVTDTYINHTIGQFSSCALLLNVRRDFLEACPANAPWNPDTGTCGTPNHCETAPNLGNSAWSGYNASSFSICKDGCTYTDVGVGFVQVIDGVEYYRSTDWEASGAQCTNTPTAPAPPDSDGDGTSDGFDPSPNNPGSGGGGGADGASQPEDGHCGGEGQPACGDPGSGSGNGNTSGGGGNCKSPPSSTGDPILAQIAYQTWATRCAIEGQGIADSGNGDDDNGQPDWTKGNAPPTPGGDDQADIDGATRFGIGVGPSLLDQTDIFGGGSCPQFSFQIAGTTISSNEYPQWCNVVAIMRALILIFGAYTALRILMGSE